MKLFISRSTKSYEAWKLVAIGLIWRSSGGVPEFLLGPECTTSQSQSNVYLGSTVLMR